MISKKLFGLAVILAVTPWAAPQAYAAPLNPQAIVDSTFETWQQSQEGETAVLEIDPKSGDVETVDTQEAAPAQDDATVAVPGQPDAVVATPEQSTDVPDEAAAQVASDPEVKEEVVQAAKEAKQDAAEDQKEPDPFLVHVQVLLDRAFTSPGEIDGMLGENTHKAVEAYQTIHGLTVNGEINADLWKSLSENTDKPVETYEITQEDLDARFVDEIPDDYAELAELEFIGYHNMEELIAERFHMDEGLLKLLNPDADFNAAGTQINVVAAGGAPEAEVTHIIVDKAKGELRAYANDGDEPVFVAPATIGSQDTPSPSGNVDVVAVVRDPTYSYNPDKNFKQGENDEKLQIAAGPNGPVGNVWIDLSKPTYGIHGTPKPNLIDKSASHGCVRLTNWDASRLAEIVKAKKTTVEFAE